jgi:signal transduction histidine kinase
MKRPDDLPAIVPDIAAFSTKDSAEARELARLRREIADRDDILSLAAHELRNPLHALALHLALARTTSREPEVADRIRRAESTLKRYSERVTVLMELLARPGAVYPLSPRPVDVGALLQALAESLEQDARSRRIELRVDVQPHPAGWLRRIDAVAFEQAIDNLVLNAFKHSAASVITIRLRAEAGAWVVEVEDNGRGIAPEDQVAIFEKFGVAAHSTRGSGTGLGLWIVARLVHAMPGEISLASTPGTGARFTIRIPDSNEMKSKP